MNNLLVCMVTLAGLSVAASAAADTTEDPYRPSISSSKYKLKAGMGLDVGVPDGAALGLVVSPWLPWVKLEAAGTYNYMSEGIRGSLTLDPFNSPVGLTLTGDVGGYFSAIVPGVSNSPTLAYTYENILLGTEFGKRNGFRFFFRGGLSHLDLNASNFQGTFTLPSGVTVGNPHVSAWAAPAFKLGFQWLF